MKIVVSLRNDQRDLPMMLRRVQKRLTDPPQDASNLTATILAYVTGAKSESALKIVWKHARVLEYLHDHKKVPLAHLAREFRIRGGIEKLALKAAQECPRRTKRQKNMPTSERSSPASAELRCSVRPKVAYKLRSLATGTEVRLVGIRTAVRGLTPGAIIALRKVVPGGHASR
jgi:hypothetical protein